MDAATVYGNHVGRFARSAARRLETMEHGGALATRKGERENFGSPRQRRYSNARFDVQAEVDYWLFDRRPAWLVCATLLILQSILANAAVSLWLVLLGITYISTSTNNVPRSKRVSASV